MSDPRWLRVTVYAERYDVDPDTVHKWIQAGLVDIFRVGRIIRVLDRPPQDRRRYPRPTD